MTSNADKTRLLQNIKGSPPFSYPPTVFENHRKSLIQHCERSELRLHFEWTLIGQKNDGKCQN